MEYKSIENLAIDYANEAIKNVDKNSLSAIADYDRGLREGFIAGYEIAIKEMIKSIVNDYTETKRQLLKEQLIAINTEEALNSGKAVQLNSVVFDVNAQCCDMRNKILNNKK